MRQPKQQAEFFKLLSTLFYYMISGNSNIGYLAKDEWNPYYKEKHNLHVSPALVLVWFRLRITRTKGEVRLLAVLLMPRNSMLLQSLLPYLFNPPAARSCKHFIIDDILMILL